MRSALFTLPLGFATGLLASTIAVGGFVEIRLAMLIVAVSRALVVPVYLGELGVLAVTEPAATVLKGASFACMVAALAVGAFVIVGAMIKGRQLPTGP